MAGRRRRSRGLKQKQIKTLDTATPKQMSVTNLLTETFVLPALNEKRFELWHLPRWRTTNLRDPRARLSVMIDKG